MCVVDLPSSVDLRGYSVELRIRIFTYNTDNEYIKIICLLIRILILRNTYYKTYFTFLKYLILTLKICTMRTIAIVAGGDSSEYEVSVKSASEVARLLSPAYLTYIIMIRGINWYWEDSKGRYHNIDKNDFTLNTDDQKIRFDAVFVAIHGTPGENGLLQGYFDMMKIPYTSCGTFCSALTFNKQATKLYLKEYGITMGDAVLIRKGDKPEPTEILSLVGLPCFVKPNESGSSFGVTKVKTEEELPAAIEEAFKESSDVMVEAFMKGREVACGVVKVRGKASSTSCN